MNTIITKTKNLIAPLCGVIVLSVTQGQAASVTLDALRDHSGLIEDNGNAVGQYDRVDTLWGSTSASRQRNGLIEFNPLSAGDKADLISGAQIITSVTLELWSGGPGWATTSLNFLRLNDADADWGNGIADDGSAGVASWTDKVESSDTAWSGGVNGGGTRGEVFGTLTSSNPGETLGTTKYTVALTGAGLLDWLSGSINPNLLVEETVPGAGAQTRFATINSADTADEFAPNLVVVTEFVPEPSSTALLGLGALGFILRRRR